MSVGARSASGTFGPGSRRPSLTSGRRGVGRRAERGCRLVAADSRGQSRPRSYGIKAAEGEERAKFGVRTAVGTRLRAPVRGRLPLGSRPPRGCFSPLAPRRGGNSCAVTRGPCGRRPAERGAAGERLAEDGRLLTALRGLCPASHEQPRNAGFLLGFSDLHPVPRGCLLLSARTLGIPGSPRLFFEAALRPCPQRPVPPSVRARGPAPRPR